MSKASAFLMFALTLVVGVHIGFWSCVATRKPCPQPQVVPAKPKRVYLSGEWRPWPANKTNIPDGIEFK